MTLKDALSACKPSEYGTRMAVTVPDGRFCAVERRPDRKRVLEVRRVATYEGLDRSQDDGAWVTPEFAAQLDWRPA